MTRSVRATDWRCWVAWGLCALTGCAGIGSPRSTTSARSGMHAEMLAVRDAAPATSPTPPTPPWAPPKPVALADRSRSDASREPVAVTTARKRSGTEAVDITATSTSGAIAHRVAAKIDSTTASASIDRSTASATAVRPDGAASKVAATGVSKSSAETRETERATSLALERGSGERPVSPRGSTTPLAATPTIASPSPNGFKKIPDLGDADEFGAERGTEVKPPLVELTSAADVETHAAGTLPDDATHAPRASIGAVKSAGPGSRSPGLPSGTTPKPATAPGSATASGLRHVSADAPSGGPSLRTVAAPLVPAASDGVPVPAASTETAPAPGSGPTSSVMGDFILPAGYQLSLANILQLAGAQNPNIALAQERILESYARVDRAESLWLPSLRAGLNYNHHEGRIQDVAGNVIETTRSSAFAGLGANAVGAGSPAVPGLVAQFHLTDAIFQPRIASHHAASRQFNATVVRNNTLRDAAVAYLELIRAERAFAIAHEALQNTAKLELLTRRYAEAGQGLRSDHHRVETELALRQEQCETEREAVTVASARLAQILHVDPAALISSGEPAVVPLEVLPVKDSAMSFVALGLSRRPELCEQRHLVGEAVERLRREQYAPLIPSVLLGMSYGGLGGGLGSKITNTGDRWDADAVAYWEVRNFGVGERAARNETSSIVRQARLREVVLLDNVAREVAESHAQVTQRQRRVELVRKGIPAAERSYALNSERIENLQGLPIEALQAIQSLATARKAYLNAVIDYNVAQFELCRATGWFLEG